MNFLGIYREPEFSPGRHTSNDALILRLVRQALEQQGVALKLVTLEESREHWKEYDLIFSMCQGPMALKELLEWKKQGARILNDPTGSLNTYRDTLYRTLSLESLPFPRSTTLPTDGSALLQHYSLFFETGSAWLKRADVHATGPDDVVRIKTHPELAPALEKFKARGLASAILQEHIEGDEVKFYAVRGDHFFWPFYPKDCIGHPFDEDVLQKIADAAARVLGVNIYGGDAIISANGRITLIDVNDWPSFAPCRGAAAYAIAKFLKESYAKQDTRTTITT